MSEDAVVPQPSETERKLEFLATRDLSKLQPEERLAYLYQLHVSMGINPLSRAFDFLTLKNPDGTSRTIIYANRTAADQLAHKNNIQSKILYEGPLRLGDLERKDIYMVEMELTMGERSLVSVGTVAIGAQQGDKLLLSQGDALSNGIMKCHTKAWRRGVLQMMGCGFPDESETDSIPGAQLPQAEPAPRLLQPQSEPAPEVQDTGTQPVQVARLPRPLPAARPPR